MARFRRRRFSTRKRRFSRKRRGTSFKRRRIIKNRSRIGFRGAQFHRIDSLQHQRPHAKFIRITSPLNFGTGLAASGGTAYYYQASGALNDLVTAAAPVTHRDNTTDASVNRELKGYQKYRVLAAKIKMHAQQKSNSDSTALFFWMVCIPAGATAPTFTTVDGMKTFPGIKYKSFRTKDVKAGFSDSFLQDYCTLMGTSIHPPSEIEGDGNYEGGITASTGAPVALPNTTWNLYYGTMGASGFTTAQNTGDIFVAGGTITWYVRVDHSDPKVDYA